MTGCVALLGHPVAHSVSPAMQEAAFARAGLAWRFLPFNVPPERLEAAVRGLLALGFMGANVTVPHKKAALALADVVEERAARVGACNVLRFVEGRIEASNTDAVGFVEAFEEAFGPGSLRDVNVLVVGAGGAARAVVAACVQQEARHIAILNRTLERAEALVDDLQDSGGRLEAHPLGRFAEAVSDTHVVIQTTSAGMSPALDTSPAAWPTRIPPALKVYDIVYHPRETRFMREAAERGAAVSDGLGMLVAQGAHAFEWWTGRPAPRDVMRQAAESAMAVLDGS